MKRCKGVKQSVVKNEIAHEDYKTTLFSGKEQRRTMNVIRSHKHEVHTEEVNKVALSANDDKRVDLKGWSTYISSWTLENRTSKASRTSKMSRCTV